MNSVVHSQLYSPSGVYLPPKKHLQEIRRLSFRFIWEEKREVIKQQTIDTSEDYGGLGLNREFAKLELQHLRTSHVKGDRESSRTRDQ